MPDNKPLTPKIKQKIYIEKPIVTPLNKINKKLKPNGRIKCLIGEVKNL